MNFEPDIAHVMRVMPQGLMAKLLEFSLALENLSTPEPLTIQAGSYRVEWHRSRPRICPLCGQEKI